MRFRGMAGLALGLGAAASWSRRARLWLGLLLLEVDAMMQRLGCWSAMGWRDGRVVEAPVRAVVWMGWGKRALRLAVWMRIWNIDRGIGRFRLDAWDRGRVVVMNLVMRRVDVVSVSPPKSAMDTTTHAPRRRSLHKQKNERKKGRQKPAWGARVRSFLLFLESLVSSRELFDVLKAAYAHAHNTRARARWS